MPPPPPPRPRVPRSLVGSPAALLVAGALAATLLADLPGAFTRGDVLRGALLPLAAAVLLAGSAFSPGPAPGRTALVLAALAAAVPLLSVVGAGRGALTSAPALARGAAPWLSLAGLGYALARLLAVPGTLRAAWRALLVAGAAAGAWVYLDALDRGAAGAGPFGRPGVAGPVLGALLGPALALPWAGRRWPRVLVAVLIAGGAALAESRTGLAAALLSVGVALGAGPARTLPPWVRRGGATALLLGGLAAALLLAGALPAPGDGRTLAVRRGVWAASARLVAERPLTGHGLGSFRSEVLRVREPEEARLSRGREPYMAHNDLLHAAAEGGLPAGLALAAWLVLALRLGLARLRRGATAAEGAALAVLAALAAAGLCEQTLGDPAPALLAAVALGTLLGTRAGAGRPGPDDPGERRGEAGPADALRFGAGRAATLAAALLLAGVAWSRARDAAADACLASYRAALRAEPTAERAREAARDFLTEGALRWRPDAAEALAALGVNEAELGRWPAARERLRAALALEPGLTEARLNLAQTFVEEGRPEDARAALEEAQRHDPTRYDLALRLGHVAYGPEPLPVPPAGIDVGFSPFECLRRYNAAEALAPDRFETHVAFARVWRRVGRLDEAGAALRAAVRAAEAFFGDEGGAAPVPAEALLESFLLAEAEGRADDLELANLLTLGLATDPALAPVVTAQAARIETEALAREERARAEARATAPLERGPAERAYAALYRRLLGLMGAGHLEADALVREARACVAQGRFRSAFTRQQAVLVYAGEVPPEGEAARTAFFGRRGALLIEAAQAASRFDGALARRSYAEGHLLTGLALLGRGEAEEALRLLARAREEAPEDARACVGEARALARLGRPEAAETALLEALRRDPSVRSRLAAEPDLGPLLARPALRAALAAPR